jgi:hypothetical protein
LNAPINAVTEYANGGTTLTRAVTAGIQNPIAIALGPDGTLFVANNNNFSGLQTVTAYAPGTTNPAYSVSMPAQGPQVVQFIADIAVDERNTLYVDFSSSGAEVVSYIYAFPNGGNGTQPTILYVTGEPNGRTLGPLVMGPP